MSGAVVASYASRGLRLWAQGNTGHGRQCPCLICADTRAYLAQQARRAEQMARRAAS